MSFSWNGYDTAWEMQTAFGTAEVFIGYNYIGYQSVAPIVFPNGFQIGDTNNDYVGDERMVDGGPTAPPEPTHLQGDVRINSKPAPGSNLAWVDTPSFTTSLSANVTVGVTTSVAVAACSSLQRSWLAGTP